MLAIFNKEIRSFFTTPVGYLVSGSFLVLNGLFLWVFRGPYNIFDYGFADLGNFFMLAPWVFLFLIPAITMRSFSEEKKQGTLELLLIRPISLWDTVLGKFLGTTALALIAIAPTLLYVVGISELGTTPGNLDTGLIIGSYFGLLFLVACYTAIGLFASALTENQIVAFIGAVVLCFVLYHGFNALSTLQSGGNSILFLQGIGMKWHYERMAAGFLDSRDLLYFSSITFLFLFLSVWQIKHPRN